MDALLGPGGDKTARDPGIGGGEASPLQPGSLDLSPRALLSRAGEPGEVCVSERTLAAVWTGECGTGRGSGGSAVP